MKNATARWPLSASPKKPCPLKPHSRTAIVLCAYALIGWLATAGEPCVKVRITNCFGRTIRVTHGPATLCAEVRVEPKAEHRKLIVSWDYAERTTSMLDTSQLELDGEPLDSLDPEPQNGVIGSAEDDLDGADEPILIRPGGFKLESLSGGSYEVKAVVTNSHQRQCGSARATVIVR